MHICVGIVTQNRRDDCLKAIASAFGQTVPIRVVLVDNASNDGVGEEVAARFPDVEIVRLEENAGVTGGRNRVLDRCDSDYCFFLDNDAEFPDSTTLRRAVGLLQQTPRAAVLGLSIEEYGRTVYAPRSTAELVPTKFFHGAGHLVRTSALREVGNYNESIIAYNEESDLALRLLDRGWLTVCTPILHVRHNKNPNRDVAARRRLRFAHEILFKWQYCPLPWLPVAITAQVCSVLRERGCLRGIRELVPAVQEAWRMRRRFSRLPVRGTTYGLWRMLARPADAISVEAITARLPEC